MNYKSVCNNAAILLLQGRSVVIDDLCVKAVEWDCEEGESPCSDCNMPCGVGNGLFAVCDCLAALSRKNYILEFAES